jgi:esterase/lipase
VLHCKRRLRGTSLTGAAAPAFPPLPAELGALPEHVAKLEARHTDIVPGTEKQIRFGPAGICRAAWAVVYLHGFSASRQETWPLTEQVAQALGAHHFATRLTGHGRGGAAMADASVAAWQADALEACAIGQVLGERTLVVGVSTGASLAAWLAQQPQCRDDTAWVLISPNFGLADRRSEIINWPAGRSLARWIIGPEHGFEARNEAHARYWTTRYPTEALFPLMALVKLVRRLPFEHWCSPVLMLLAPRDRVIDSHAARAAFARIAARQKRLVEVDDASDEMQHVIAGRILSPGSTQHVAATILDWVRTVP